MNARTFPVSYGPKSSLFLEVAHKQRTPVGFVAGELEYKVVITKYNLVSDGEHQGCYEVWGEAMVFNKKHQFHALWFDPDLQTGEIEQLNLYEPI